MYFCYIFAKNFAIKGDNVLPTGLLFHVLLNKTMKILVANTLLGNFLKKTMPLMEAVSINSIYFTIFSKVLCSGLCSLSPLRNAIPIPF